ncbi:MAG: hypothetical protein JNJ90_11440 [Saprospiraceae bacterium]|nr:hypothetical protein [Saprospiraceae bacterium]
MVHQKNTANTRWLSRISFSLLLLAGAFSAFGQSISGRVHTETGVGVEEVNISVTGPGVSLFDLTDNNGNFSITGLPTGESYEVCAFKNDNPLNGVTTLDQVVLTKHILDVELLNSPYKIIAAVARNENAPPDVLDLYLARQMILGVYTELPAPSWKFVPAEFVFPDPAHPFAYPFPLGCKTFILTGDATGVDFIGIKTADVNGNAVPSN